MKSTAITTNVDGEETNTFNKKNDEQKKEKRRNFKRRNE